MAQQERTDDPRDEVARITIEDDIGLPINDVQQIKRVILEMVENGRFDEHEDIAKITHVTCEAFKKLNAEAFAHDDYERRVRELLTPETK